MSKYLDGNGLNRFYNAIKGSLGGGGVSYQNLCVENTGDWSIINPVSNTLRLKYFYLNKKMNTSRKYYISAKVKWSEKPGKTATTPFSIYIGDVRDGTINNPVKDTEYRLSGIIDFVNDRNPHPYIVVNYSGNASDTLAYAKNFVCIDITDLEEFSGKTNDEIKTILNDKVDYLAPLIPHGLNGVETGMVDTKTKVIAIPKVPYDVIDVTHTTEKYLKNLLIWICDNYPTETSTTFIGTAYPNNEGPVSINIYDTHDVNNDGLPRYSSGRFSTFGSAIYTFGTINFNYHVWKVEGTEQSVPTVTTSQIALSGCGTRFWEGATKHPFDVDEVIRSIAYGDGYFVALGGRGTAAYSADGITWSGNKLSSVTGYQPYALTYGNGRFMTVGNNSTFAVCLSGGGEPPTSWTEQKISNLSDTPRIIGACAYCNNLFLVGTENGLIAYSSNGGAWHLAKRSQLVDYINSFAYGKGKYVAVANNGQMAYSSSADTWNKISQSVFTSSESIKSVCFGNGIFVAVGDAGKIAHSPNGVYWRSADNAADIFNNSKICSVTYGNGIFVAVGDYGKIAYSYDGQNWYAVNQSVTTNQIRSIYYGGGKFIAGTHYTSG